MAKTKIEKVNVEQLVATLIYVYNMGATFVDVVIIKDKNDEEDKITIVVRDEYKDGEKSIPNPDPLPGNSLPIINEKDIDNFFDEIS